MRAIAGAIVILAGAFLFGTGLACLTFTTAPNPILQFLALVIGAVIGVVGLIILYNGLHEDYPVPLSPYRDGGEVGGQRK
jgi:hypothetical protein